MRERDSRFIVREGETAPSFEFITSDGDTLDTDFLRGRVVVLLFAASWCPFSQAQLIDLEKYLWKHYKTNEEFSMLIINEDLLTDRQTFLNQREENKITIPYTFDDSEIIYRLFVTPKGSVTRTIIIDRSWRIIGLYDIHSWKNLRRVRKLIKRQL